ncbi:hypothetical protein Poly59_49070 [Rubripirellula reticaptiva]|uniref:Uncharacterized protein n=1 Tax=Rubripirellula reticaptiva TaxID=2528013 RepID=A0A5C6EGE6_9BACT|nr:hypothetical protein Poly59_49070 [Rubripirellula reticaptiva]
MVVKSSQKTSLTEFGLKHSRLKFPPIHQKGVASQHTQYLIILLISRAALPFH